MSVVKAPASRKSSRMTTQYIRCGETWDQGAGRAQLERRMYSLPVGAGKSEIATELLWETSPSSLSSSGNI